MEALGVIFVIILIVIGLYFAYAVLSVLWCWIQSKCEDPESDLSDSDEIMGPDQLPPPQYESFTPKAYTKSNEAEEPFDKDALLRTFIERAEKERAAQAPSDRQPPQKPVPPQPSRPPYTRATSTTASRSAPRTTQKESTPTVVLEIPELKVDRRYFTEKQAAEYIKRGASLRLGRALTQGMLLEHLKTDKTTTPFKASATVLSMHSGSKYQTTLTQCSCPDHQKRQAPCKHMLALAIYISAIELRE